MVYFLLKISFSSLRCTKQPVFEKQTESDFLSHNYMVLLNLCNVLFSQIYGHTFISLLFFRSDALFLVSHIPSDKDERQASFRQNRNADTPASCHSNNT